jgi:hypothetical protein
MKSESVGQSLKLDGFFALIFHAQVFALIEQFCQGASIVSMLRCLLAGVNRLAFISTARRELVAASVCYDFELSLTAVRIVNDAEVFRGHYFVVAISVVGALELIGDRGMRNCRKNQ